MSDWYWHDTISLEKPRDRESAGPEKYKSQVKVPFCLEKFQLPKWKHSCSGTCTHHCHTPRLAPARSVWSWEQLGQKVHQETAGSWDIKSKRASWSRSSTTRHCSQEENSSSIFNAWVISAWTSRSPLHLTHPPSPQLPHHKAQQKRCTLPENLRHLCCCLRLQHQLATACNESKRLSRQVVGSTGVRQKRWQSMMSEITTLPPPWGRGTLNETYLTAGFSLKHCKSFACTCRLLPAAAMVKVLYSYEIFDKSNWKFHHICSLNASPKC